MNEEISVCAKFTVKEGAVDTVISKLQKLIDHTRTEEGCIKYDLHQDLANPRSFVFYEVWANKDALKAHGDSDNFKQTMAELQEYTEGPSENTLMKKIS
ncbi:putative quinol monooxygenase [Spirochaeta cellobiosiphila]|uniref:putative quinol monooxygenase n=1 Tax=Spirochaeta cellobiosiphila TaxID=504483 RepID=UPI0003F666FA|nr:putative quinol monooxygenase [Spirochaeta cellobiosiphila]